MGSEMCIRDSLFAEPMRPDRGARGRGKCVIWRGRFSRMGLHTLPIMAEVLTVLTVLAVSAAMVRVVTMNGLRVASPSLKRRKIHNHHCPALFRPPCQPL